MTILLLEAKPHLCKPYLLPNPYHTWCNPPNAVKHLLAPPPAAQASLLVCASLCKILEHTPSSKYYYGHHVHGNANIVEHT